MRPEQRATSQVPVRFTPAPAAARVSGLMRVQLLVAAVALSTAACANLTAPPSPEAIASEAPVAAAAPKASASAFAIPPQAVREHAPPPGVRPEPPAGSEPPVQKVDLAAGSGAVANKGDVVSVHYTGTLTDQAKTQFDSSRARGPFSFTIGSGQVIRGWDLGVAGMKVGGKRKLTIPYVLAYGEGGRPPTIPPKSDLIFDIELLSVTPPGAAPPEQANPHPAPRRPPPPKAPPAAAGQPVAPY